MVAPPEAPRAFTASWRDGQVSGAAAAGHLCPSVPIHSFCSSSSSSHRDISHHASLSSSWQVQTVNSQHDQVRLPVVHVSMSYHGNDLFGVEQVMSLLGDVRKLQRDKR